MTPTADEVEGVDGVVVTGVGLVTCLGLSTETTWSRVRRAECGLGPVASLESRLSPDKGGGEAPDLPGLEGDREVGFLRLALREAIGQSGISAGVAGAQPRTAIVLGTTLHGMRRAGEYLRTGRIGALEGFLAPAVLGRAIHSVPIFGRGFEGTSFTTCAACSSGLSSVGLALTLLRAGELDIVIAGGYDPVSEYAHAGFDSLRVVASGQVRPFCRQRDGMKVSEGYGILVLERAADAQARGARSLACIRGYGESADAHHLTLPHPEGDGAARAIEQALHRAGASPAEIGLIAAHATATPNNDAAEYAAFRRVFGDGLTSVPMVAFKSHLGHTLGGAGAVELILSIMAMRDGAAPPTAGIAIADLEFPDLGLIAGRERPASIDLTLNTSLGFGGANTCVIAGQPGRKSFWTTGTAPRKVAITGVGVVVPGAIGNAPFTDRLSRRRDGPASGEAGGIPESQIEHLFASRRVRRMSDYVKLTLAATALALEDAGVAGDAAFAESCSAILGTTHGSTGFSEAYYSQIVREGPAAANPVLFAEGVPNAASAQLSLMLGLKGGCQTIIGSRTAGLDALRLAALRVASGEWDRAIVGAAEESSALVDRAYGHCGLCAGEWSPPFASERGFVTGAGAVSLIVEPASAAIARGGHVRGVVNHAAGATGSAASAVARVVEQLERGGPPGVPALGSANATWIDGCEAAGLAARGRTVSAWYGWVPELFSAGPLAGLAGVLLSGRVPGRVGPAMAARTGEERAGLFDVLCTDYAGAVTGVRLGLSV